MKQRFYINLFLLLALGLSAQTVNVMPQVINAAGNHRQLGNTGIWITDNVGEPFIQTVYGNGLSMMITEGFIQPEIVSLAHFTVTPIQNNYICKDKEDDAFIALNFTTNVDPKKYDVKYYWTPSSVCPNNDCDRIDTVVAGDYSVKVKVTYTTNVGVVLYDSIMRNFTINNALTPCKVKIFSGVTPNNDRLNDFFDVENIKEYPKSHVMIFNRWGNQLADIEGYNAEISGKRWPEDSDLSSLTSTTYFYIVELGDGSGPMKGWLELIK